MTNKQTSAHPLWTLHTQIARNREHIDNMTTMMSGIE